MLDKLYMKKLAVILGCLLLLIVACSGCISPATPAQNNTTTTDPIIGTWQSTDSFTVNGEDLYVIYEIHDDNTGYAMLAAAGSAEAEKIDIYWGNDNGSYVIAYASDTTTVYPHTISADGKIMTDKYGDTFTKI